MWLGVLLVVAAVALLMIIVRVSVTRRWGSAFDDTVAPADDLRRADDGGTPSLTERDGTGGFL